LFVVWTLAAGGYVDKTPGCRACDLSYYRDLQGGYGYCVECPVVPVGLCVALNDAHWSALCREPMTCDLVPSSSNRCCCLWCGPSPPWYTYAIGAGALLLVMPLMMKASKLKNGFGGAPVQV
jgi:hypothetical protein